MSLDFPSPAVSGQVYAPIGGPVYKFENGVWTVITPLENSGSTLSARSLLNWIDPSKHAAIAAGTYSAALNAEIQTALNSGENIFVPPGTYTVDCHGSSYLLMSAQGQKISGVGADSLFKNIAANGTAAAPILIVEGADCILEDLAFDHHGTLLINPTMPNIAFGDCVILAGDRDTAHRLQARNAWGNGIGISSYNRMTGVQTNGLPMWVKVKDCHTSYCGSGTESHLAGTIGIFNAGAGVNNLTGGYALITNCTDLYSTQNFIQDYAGGGTSIWVGCVGYGARKSQVGTFPDMDRTPGGQGFYCGGIANVIGMEIFDSEGDSFWFDAFSLYCQGVNLLSKASKQRGLLLSGKHNNVNIYVADASYTHSGVYAAITVKGLASVTTSTFTHSTGLVLADPRTLGTTHKYGVEVVNGGGSGEFTAEGVMNGGYLNGTVAPYINSASDPFLFIADGYKSGSQFISGRRNIYWTTSNATVNPVGDGNGSFIVSDLATPTKRLAMGVDRDRTTAVIQAMHAGVVALPLELNIFGTAGQAPVAVGMGAMLNTTAALQVDGDILFGPNASIIATNLYFDGSWKYVGNGFGMLLRCPNNGNFEMYSAPSNAAGAGAAATFTLVGRFGAVNPMLGTLGTFANDGAAAAAGVPVNGLYRNGNAVQIRVS